MDKTSVYLFSDGSWCWAAEMIIEKNILKGEGHEVIIGTGWHNYEVSEMLKSYFEENRDHIFG